MSGHFFMKTVMASYTGYTTRTRQRMLILYNVNTLSHMCILCNYMTITFLGFTKILQHVIDGILCL